MRALFGLVALLVMTTASWALSLGDISNQEASGGIKEALSQGVDAAVSSPGKVDGFLGNDKVRIPLPGALERARN